MMFGAQLFLFPEGIEWMDFMTPVLADSPVGKGDVVRILQYGVREGGEAGEVVAPFVVRIAKRKGSVIMQVEV